MSGLVAKLLLLLLKEVRTHQVSLLAVKVTLPLPLDMSMVTSTSHLPGGRVTAFPVYWSVEALKGILMPALIGA
ncbi:hypothetical protein D3C86_2070960 [compost metagenome]